MREVRKGRKKQRVQNRDFGNPVLFSFFPALVEGKPGVVRGEKGNTCAKLQHRTVEGEVLARWIMKWGKQQVCGKAGGGGKFLKGGECKPSSKACSSDGRNEGNIKKIYNTWEKLLGRFRQPHSDRSSPSGSRFLE